MNNKNIISIFKEINVALEKMIVACSVSQEKLTEFKKEVNKVIEENDIDED